MKKQNDDTYSQENGVIDRDEDLLESNSAPEITPEAKADELSKSDSSGSEIADETVFSKRTARDPADRSARSSKFATSDDMADFKFIKRHSSGSSHSGASHRLSSSHHYDEPEEADDMLLAVSSRRSTLPPGRAK